MKTITIKPKRGLLVLDPEGGVLPEDGKAVTLTPYWRRRLQDGDVKPVRSLNVSKSKSKEN